MYFSDGMKAKISRNYSKIWIALPMKWSKISSIYSQEFQKWGVCLGIFSSNHTQCLGNFLTHATLLQRHTHVLPYTVAYPPPPPPPWVKRRIEETETAPSEKKWYIITTGMKRKKETTHESTHEWSNQGGQEQTNPPGREMSAHILRSTSSDTGACT